jgi:hypothetical protein
MAKKHSRKMKTYHMQDFKAFETGKLKWKEVEAYNYIDAAKKMRVSPYMLRTYGHIKLKEI